MRAGDLIGWHQRAMAAMAAGQTVLNESHAFLTVMRRPVNCVIHYYHPEQQICILTREFAQPHLGGAVRLLIGQRSDDTFRMVTIGVSPGEAPQKLFVRGFLLTHGEAQTFIDAYRS
jgi:hypothetical protein